MNGDDAVHRPGARFGRGGGDGGGTDDGDHGDGDGRRGGNGDGDDDETANPARRRRRRRRRRRTRGDSGARRNTDGACGHGKGGSVVSHSGNGGRSCSSLKRQIPNSDGVGDGGGNRHSGGGGDGSGGGVGDRGGETSNRKRKSASDTPRAVIATKMHFF